MVGVGNEEKAIGYQKKSLIWFIALALLLSFIKAETDATSFIIMDQRKKEKGRDPDSPPKT